MFSCACADKKSFGVSASVIQFVLLCTAMDPRITAAVTILSQYRTPPNSVAHRRTYWEPQQDGTLSCLKFEECDEQENRCSEAKAHLLIMHDRQIFDKCRLDALLLEDDVVLLFVLHLNGRVHGDVTNQNIRRGSIVEVHAGNDRPLYEPLHPPQLVPAKNTMKLLEALELPTNGVVPQACLPSCLPTSPECIFTGAKEGDVVEVLLPGLPAFFVVMPMKTTPCPRS